MTSARDAGGNKSRRTAPAAAARDKLRHFADQAGIFARSSVQTKNEEFTMRLRFVPWTICALAAGCSSAGPQPESSSQTETILRALHLDPEALKAVRQEGTRVLPGLF
jgi:uracil-DNA glycosylase